MKRSPVHSVVRAIASVALVAGLVRTTPAHHTAPPAQTPRPPAPRATTTVTHFDSGSIIIPMDGCYARMSYMGNSDLDQIVAPATRTTAVCNDASEKDGGLIPSYTLVMRLIQAGIPVSWSIKGSKSGWNDIDFTIVKVGGRPVDYRVPGGTTNTTKYSSLTAINYRGAPFVIDAAHATAALAVMDGLAGTCDTGTCYSAVDLHIAQTGFDAPIYRTLTTLTKLAVINVDDATTNFQNPQTNFLKGSITEALMNPLENIVWYEVSVDQVLADRLTSESFDLAWVPAFNIAGAGAASTRQAALFTKLAAFADAGGNLVFQDGGIQALEGTGTMSGMTYTAAKPSNKLLQTQGGLVVNGTSSTYDNGADTELVLGTDYSDPASQFGGSFWTGVGGSQYNWKPRYDMTYEPGVRRMLYSDHTTDATKDRWDFATWRYKDNDTAKGRIFYLGGFNWRRNTGSGFRILMNTLLVAAQESATYTTLEVSRSAPIIATVGTAQSQYQGTFEIQQNDADDEDVLTAEDAPVFTGASSADDFEFPFFKGHLRAFPTADITTTAEDFDDATATFDVGADGSIPTPDVGGCGTNFAGSCRTVFTTTATPDSEGLAVAPARVYFSTANLAALKPLLAPSMTDAETTTLMERVLAGVPDGVGGYDPALGGIDRSTMAIIEASPLALTSDGEQRPTMIYVGALDGMMHAICAEVRGACTAVGRELWAYIPRSQLAALKYNIQRVDGSPKVADVFDDFDGDDRPEWRTVMTFQTGYGSSALAAVNPSVVAIDITDPTDPDILWTRTEPTTPGTVDFGIGLNIAMGPARISGATRNVAFVQTNNGGTGGSGFYLAAYDISDGARLWEVEHSYPTPRDTANPPVPDSGIPGGVAGFDLTSSSMITHIAVPSLYGEMYIIQADGTNQYGTSPAFQFTTDFHPIGAPPAIFADQLTQQLQIAIVSGGYADPSVADWALLTSTQYVVAMVAEPTSVPINETTANAERTQLVNIGTNRAFSQAVVAGNELFVTTDSTDVNLGTYGTTPDTGKLWRVNLSGSVATSQVITSGGASSVDVDVAGGHVYTGSGTKVQRVDPASFDAEGVAIEKNVEDATQRLLWISG